MRVSSGKRIAVSLFRSKRLWRVEAETWPSAKYMTSGFREGRKDGFRVSLPPYPPATSLVPTQSTGVPRGSSSRATTRSAGAGASAVRAARVDVLETRSMSGPGSTTQTVAGRGCPEEELPGPLPLGREARPRNEAMLALEVQAGVLQHRPQSVVGDREKAPLAVGGDRPPIQGQGEGSPGFGHPSPDREYGGDQQRRVRAHRSPLTPISRMRCSAPSTADMTQSMYRTSTWIERVLTGSKRKSEAIVS